jgi:hypothetical protein
MKPVLSTFVIMLLFLISFSGCNENEEIIIGGTITSYPDQEPINGAEVKLSAQLIDQGSFNSTFRTLETEYTAEDGSFEIKIDPVRANEFKLDISCETYRSKSIEFYLDESKSEKYINENLVLYASLSVHIKNTYTPVSASDLLKIRIQGIPDACDNCSGSDFTYLEGANIDTVLIYQVTGNDEVLVEYSVDKEEDSYHTMRKYCQPGDSNMIQITY